MQTNATPNGQFFIEFLRDELISRCQSNPGYSLRAFARDLEIDNSVLSKILNGKRKVGSRVINRLSNQLNLDVKTRLSFFEDNDCSQANQAYQQLAIDSFKIISDWQHYAILELIRMDNFKSDVGFVSDTLGISILEAKAAVDRLKRVGLIEIDDSGHWIDVSGGKSTNISNDMTSSALKKMQEQLLQKSIESMYKVPYELRNNTSMTMAIDVEKLDQAQVEIKKFRRKLANLLSRGEKRNDVYNLSISLFPLTEQYLGDI